MGPGCVRAFFHGLGLLLGVKKYERLQNTFLNKHPMYRAKMRVV